MNMKTRLVLGDIHGHQETFVDIYNKHKPDEVILLGDYCDSYSRSTAEVILAFQVLLEYRQNHIEKYGGGTFKMLLGNHDFHYIDYHEEYSGYKASTWTGMHQTLVDSLNDGVLQIAYIDEINKTIYSHAGISKTWLEKVCKGSDIFYINKFNLDWLRFNYLGGFDCYGNTKTSSCIWIRPMALLGDMVEGYTQIVGHTHTHEPLFLSNDTIDFKTDIDNAQLIVIDTLPKGYILEILDDNGKIIKREYIEYEV